MSILIDRLIYDNHPQQCINGKWYIAKWLKLTTFSGFLSRLKDAWRVINDKSRAYHYKEDEI